MKKAQPSINRSYNETDRENHRKYVERINALVERAGENYSMDGLPIRRNCVAEAQRAAFERQYKSPYPLK